MASPGENAGVLRGMADQLSSLTKAYDATAPDALEKKAAIGGIARAIIAETMEPGDMAGYHHAMMTEIVAIRTLMSYPVFEMIPMEGSISLAKLSEGTGVQQSLLERLFRVLVANHFIEQTPDGEYAHSKFSRAYTSFPGLFFKLIHDTFLQPMSGFSDYLKRYGPKEPMDIYSNPYLFFHKADNSGKSTWQVMSTGDPEKFETFQKGLGAMDAMCPVIGYYDFGALAGVDSGDAPTFVDVAGGQGQSLKQILTAHPQLQPGKTVLQDMEHVIELTKSSGVLPEGVKTQVIDFFVEQPVKGAAAYYIRRVLHDWDDDSVVKILSGIAKAMAPHSRLLIADFLIPSKITEADLSAVAMDVTMLMTAGKERSKEGFEDVLGRSGLALSNIYRAPVGAGAIVEATLVA